LQDAHVVAARRAAVSPDAAAAMASAARALQRRAVMQAHQPIGPDGLLLT